MVKVTFPALALPFFSPLVSLTLLFPWLLPVSSGKVRYLYFRWVRQVMVKYTTPLPAILSGCILRVSISWDKVHSSVQTWPRCWLSGASIRSSWKSRYTLARLESKQVASIKRAAIVLFSSWFLATPGGTQESPFAGLGTIWGCRELNPGWQNANPIYCTINLGQESCHFLNTCFVRGHRVLHIL